MGKHVLKGSVFNIDDSLGTLAQATPKGGKVRKKKPRQVDYTVAPDDQKLKLYFKLSETYTQLKTDVSRPTSFETDDQQQWSKYLRLADSASQLSRRTLSSKEKKHTDRNRVIKNMKWPNTRKQNNRKLRETKAKGETSVGFKRNKQVTLTKNFLNFFKVNFMLDYISEWSLH